MVLYSANTITDHQISDALRRFGISDKTTSLLAIKIIDSAAPTLSSDPPTTTSTPSHSSATTQDTIRNFFSTAIEGTPVPFSDAELEKLRDVPAIAKLYKLGASLSSAGGGSSGKKGQTSTNGTANGAGAQDELERQRKEVKELEVQILGLMAIKGA